MSEAEMVDTQLRIKALQLAAKGAAGETPIEVITHIANHYYQFLKGELNE